MPPKVPFDPTAYAAKRKEQIERAKELRKARSSLLGGPYDGNDHRMIHETVDPYHVPVRKSRSRGASPPRSTEAVEALSSRRARSRGASPSRDPATLYKSSTGTRRRASAGKIRAPTIAEDEVPNMSLDERDSNRSTAAYQNTVSLEDAAPAGAPAEAEAPLRRRTVGGNVLVSAGANDLLPGGVPRPRRSRDGFSSGRNLSSKTAARGKEAEASSLVPEKVSLMTKLKRLFRRSSDPPVPTRSGQGQDGASQDQDQGKGQSAVQSLISKRSAARENGKPVKDAAAEDAAVTPEAAEDTPANEITPAGAAADPESTAGGADSAARVPSRLSRKHSQAASKDATPGSAETTPVAKVKPATPATASPTAAKSGPAAGELGTVTGTPVAFGSNVKRGVPWDHTEGTKEGLKRVNSVSLKKEEAASKEVSSGKEGAKKQGGVSASAEKGKRADGSRLSGTHDDPKHVPCPHCNRKFLVDSLQKHEKICKKVFIDKRKPFNSTKKRIEGTDAAEFVKIQKKSPAPKSRLSAAKKDEKKSEKEVSSPGGAAVPPEAAAHKRSKSTAPEKPIATSTETPSDAKMPKWKAQSLELQEAIRAAREMRAKRAS